MLTPEDKPSVYDIGDEIIPTMATQALEEIVLTPDMSPAEYATLVLLHQRANTTEDVALIWRPTAQQFVRQVDDGFRTLIEERPIVELEEARSMFVEYGKDIKPPSLECGIPHAEINDGPYKNWMRKLRMLAGLSHSWKTEKVGYSAEDPDALSSVQFWREIYLETAKNVSEKEAYTLSIFTPGIEVKDRNLVRSAAKKLETDSVEDVFEGEVIFGRIDKLLSFGYDTFMNLVTEASEAGWPNAVRVLNWHNTIPNKRDVSVFRIVNELGNIAGQALNLHDPYYRENPIDDVDINDLDKSAQSIRRCIYLVFDLSTEPEGHSAINFKSMGFIISKLFEAASSSRV